MLIDLFKLHLSIQLMSKLSKMMHLLPIRHISQGITTKQIVIVLTKFCTKLLCAKLHIYKHWWSLSRSWYLLLFEVYGTIQSSYSLNPSRYDVVANTLSCLSQLSPSKVSNPRLLAMQSQKNWICNRILSWLTHFIHHFLQYMRQYIRCMLNLW